MVTRAGQALRCVLLAAAFALAGGGVQAAPIHPIVYDPPTGTGSVDECFFTEGCSIVLLTTDVTDSQETRWTLLEPVFATDATFVGGQLFAIQTPFFTVDIVGFTDFAPSLATAAQVCGTADMRLNLDRTTDLVNQCGLDDHGVYRILVPEPGSMALILGGAAAAWLARRRKRAA
jgi:hypothetical protein